LNVANNVDGIYTPKNRQGYWISWTDAQGRRKRRKTNAKTLSQARSSRAAELVRVEQAKALGFAPPGQETMSDVATRFLSHQKARLTPKAYTREEGVVNEHLCPFFAGPLASIRRVDIQRYISKRSSEVSAHSVQKELNILKHLLRLAVEWEIVPFNVSQGVKSPRVPAGRVRYLQPGELRAVLQTSPEWLHPIIALASCTGMRRSELLGLRWLDVDLAHSRVMLAQTKNGEGRIVYLNETAKAAISAVAVPVDARSTDLIFKAFTSEQVSMAFARACKKLKIADFRFHDLRHTAASWLRMQGADIHTVAQLLGHKDLRMAARYQHLSPAFLADAVARLDGVFDLPRHHSVTAPTEAQEQKALSA
jgi:integrase